MFAACSFQINYIALQEVGAILWPKAVIWWQFVCSWVEVSRSQKLISTRHHWQDEMEDEVRAGAAKPESMEDDAVLALRAFSKLLAEQLLICFHHLLPC